MRDSINNFDYELSKLSNPVKIVNYQVFYFFI